MISLEQVQLLETRVARAIEYVQRVSEENAALISEKAGLLSKLEANQKRLDELELLVMRFKKEQGQIEDGIVAALDRLNQFEEDFEESLKEKAIPKKSAPEKKEEKVSTHAHTHASKPVSSSHRAGAGNASGAQSNSKEFFEITETEETDVEEELSSELSGEDADGDSDDRELDIF